MRTWVTDWLCALAFVFGALFLLSYTVDFDRALSRVVLVAPKPHAKPVHPAPPYDSAFTLSIELPKGAQIWTSTARYSSVENAQAHFRKHARELGLKTVEAYVMAAHHFLHTPPEGTQTKIQKDGDIVRFHAPSTRFGVMRADGTPRTYYRMHPDIHGYPTNQAYFDDQ